MDNIVIKFTGDISGLEPAVDALEKIGQIDKKVADEFRKNNASMQERSKLLKEQTTATDASGKSIDNLSKDFKQLNETVTVGRFNKEWKDFNDGVVKASTNSKSLKAELKETVNEMAKLKLAGKDTGEEYGKLQQKAGHLKDTIEDVNKTIKATGSDTRALDGLIQGAAGVAGAFSIAQGAAALFGNENEDVQKALLKVQASLAILNGLQEIQNLLQKESAFRIGVVSVATTALGVIQKSFGVTSAAAWAIATGGITLLITGLYLLYQNFAKVKQFMEDWIPGFKQLEAGIGFVVDKIKDLYHFVAGAEPIKTLNDQLKESIQRSQDAAKHYELFGNIINKVKQAFADGKKALSDLVEQQKKQAEYIKALTESGAPGSIGRYNFLLSENTKELNKNVPGTKAYNDLLAEQINLYRKIGVEEEAAKKALDELRGSQDISKIKTLSPLLPIEDQEQKQAKSLGSFQDYTKSLGISYKEMTDKQIAEAQRKSDAEKQFQQEVSDFAANIIEFGTNMQINSLNRELREKKISQEQYDKKLKQINHQKAVQDKEQAIFNILLNEPIAISKTLAQLGVTGTAAIPIIVALVGAQIAAVASRPIPAFEKGTKNAPAGWKLVGEKGPELINDGGGYPIISNPDTKKILEKYDLPRLNLTDRNIPSIGDYAGAPIGIGNQIDYSLMAKHIGKEIAKHRSTNISIDKNGIRVIAVDGIHETEYYNNRYTA